MIAHVHEITDPNLDERLLPKVEAFRVERRKLAFLDKQSLLSHAEYLTLFDGELQQANVSNCYLIGALRAIKASPHCEAIIRTSFRADPHHAPKFYVRIPLGRTGGQEVPVTQQDLSTQKNSDPTEPLLHPVTAARGWQVLEAACHKLEQDGTLDRKKIQSGSVKDVLKVLFGDSANAIDLDILQDAEHPVLQLLQGFHPGRDFWNSISRKAPGDKNTKERVYAAQAQGRSVQLYYDHAYALTEVDMLSTPVTVTVRDPHNTANPLVFTLAEFRNAFTAIEGVRLKYNNMFQ